MIWSIGFSNEAISFLKRERRLSENDVIELIQKVVRLFDGERINIDVKKLKGEWVGFHRIRKGRIRIVAAFDFEDRSVLVERVD